MSTPSYNETKAICETGNIEDIKLLLERGGLKNVIFDIVVGCGYLKIVKYLVEECDVDPRANDDFAVISASGRNHLEVLKYLIETCGANARTCGDHAIVSASESGHLDVIKYLVEKCGLDSHLAIKYAFLEKDRQHIIQYLLDIGTFNNGGYSIKINRNL